MHPLWPENEISTRPSADQRRALPEPNSGTIGSGEARIYRFAGFTLDLVRGALIADVAGEVRLRHKSFQLLVLLVENAGRLLDRATINAAIWSRVTVTDDAITQCIRDIRRALGDSSHQFVRTVPGRGYLCTAHVTLHSHVPTRVGLPHPGSLYRPTIAVLPLANLSSDPEQTYVARGIADDVITELSRRPYLLVIARNSSFIYGAEADLERVAEQLAVRYVLQGSVRRAGVRIRISVQLIDASAGTCLWAERYDRALEHVFELQDEIARTIVQSITPAVANAEIQHILRIPTKDLNAWQAYHRGLYHLARSNNADNRRAREFFLQSARLDPVFAPAYCGLAHSYTCDALFETAAVAECAHLAEPLAMRALDLDPRDGSAMAVLAWVFDFKGDHAGAQYEADRSVDANPNCAFAYHVKGRSLLFSGNPRDSLGQFDVGFRLSPHDPLNRMAHMGVTIARYFLSDYQGSAASAQAMIRKYPEYPLPHRWLAAALGQLGDCDAAQAALSHARAISAGVFARYVHERPPWYRREDHEHMLDGLRKAGCAV